MPDRPAPQETPTVRDALAELVRLKDGPRDEAYERDKPRAWDAARRALSAAPQETPEREALQRIRLHGSPWWRDEWGTPAKVASDALDAADAALSASREEQPPDLEDEYHAEHQAEGREWDEKCGVCRPEIRYGPDGPPPVSDEEYNRLAAAYEALVAMKDPPTYQVWTLAEKALNLARRALGAGPRLNRDRLAEVLSKAWDECPDAMLKLDPRVWPFLADAVLRSFVEEDPE